MDIVTFKTLRRYVRDLKEAEVEDIRMRRKLIEEHLSCSPGLYRNNLGCRETRLNAFRLIAKQKRFATRTGRPLSHPYLEFFIQDNPELWALYNM